MTTKSTPLTDSYHWILDWDGTITKKDTLDALVNIAASTKPDFPTHDRWKHVVEAYIADYTTTSEKLAPGGTLPTTIEGERKLLKDLRVVEQRSLDRVFEANIFTGMTRDQIVGGAKAAIERGDVVLRPGCVEFFGRLSTVKGDNLHILSVNWSRYFISSCIKAAGTEVGPSLILANELEGITEGTPSSGQISPDGESKIIASNDKLRFLEKIKESTSAPIIYVGDSWTDIECLVAANLGICIRDEPMGSSQKKLAEALERLGTACPHISGAKEPEAPSIVWARDFVEIEGWASNHSERLPNAVV